MVLQKVEDLRDQSGQVLALGALSMLILALMLMMSFNLSEAIHNKIQLQQQVDAQAYSMAVVEARTFNYIAYSNRAIAADLVAMATMHAYESMMSSEITMLSAAEYNLFTIGGLEFLECCTCGPPVVCCKFQHCIHGVKAIIAGVKFIRARRKWANKLKGLEKSFNDTIKWLQRMIEIIHGSQEVLVANTMQVLRGKDLDKIRKFNAPQSSSGLKGGIAGINIENFLCAIQGTPFDSLCVKPTAPKKLSKQDQGKLLGEVANASRPGFTAQRTLLEIWANLGTTKFGKDLRKNIQGHGTSWPVFHTGTSKLTAGRSKLDGKDEGIDAQDVGGEDWGVLLTKFYDIPMALPYGRYLSHAYIYSDKNGGEHKPSQAHSGRHGEFKGVDGCMGSGACFIKFRSDSNAKHNYGQPLVYYYATRDLSVTRKGAHGPWELNKDAKVEMKWGKNNAKLILRAGTGAALSQAMVYYHRLGDWRDAPNLFSPYWRAKLHPMTHTDAAFVLGAGGNGAGATIAASPSTPVN